MHQTDDLTNESRDEFRKIFQHVSYNDDFTAAWRVGEINARSCVCRHYNRRHATETRPFTDAAV